MTDHPAIAVVILAGGEGRRMGGAKPMRSFGGSTLLGRAIETARGYGGAIAISVRSPDQLSAPAGVPLLMDDPTIEGPIAGLGSALAFAEARGADAVLTLPCDAPLLPADLGARLGAACEPPTLVAVASSKGRLHPTCALWRVGARARLTAYVRDGGRSLKGAAFACGMVAVEWGAEDADPFANANTEEDLRQLEGVPGMRPSGA